MKELTERKIQWLDAFANKHEFFGVLKEIMEKNNLSSDG